jgi:sugar diacid utilization regulator
MNAAEEMQKAMNAKDRAKEEFEEAAGRLSVADGEEDPILTALKKNLSDAKEEADKAEQAAKDAKSEYEAAVEIKEGYAAEAESINESHEAAKKAMDNAEEEYKKAVPYDATDIQLAARERA